MGTLKLLEKNKEFWFVLFTLFLFFLLRLPSLFEPLWYGDEGIYQVIGSSLNNGKLLYKEIFDNKPPFLYWLYSIFQSDQFAIRFASLVFGILTIIMFYFLVKKLFDNLKNNNISVLTTFLFTILFGLPLLEGNIANAENFMLLPIILAGYLIFNSVSRPHLSSLTSHLSPLISGILLGLAFLFKVVAIFDFLAFAVFYFIANINSFNKRKIFNNLLPFFIGFSLPIGFVSLFFILNGTLWDFIKAVFTTNISYVSYGNKIGAFPFLLIIKLVILSAFIFFLFSQRKKIKTTSLFIFIWFAFSLFNTFFAQRPYTHYVLVLLPSLCLMIGLLFDKKYQKITTAFLLISLIMVIKSFNITNFSKNIYYYQNFISFVLGKKTTIQYQRFFDSKTPTDYEIARFIKPKLTKNDTVFVWGNNAQLYQIIGVIPQTKYTVAYHISNYKDGILSTKNTIDKNKPKFIVVMPNQKHIPFEFANYSVKININNAIIYERLF